MTLGQLQPFLHLNLGHEKLRYYASIFLLGLIIKVIISTAPYNYKSFRKFWKQFKTIDDWYAVNAVSVANES